MDTALFPPILAGAGLLVSATSLAVSSTAIARQWPGGFHRVTGAATALIGLAAFAWSVVLLARRWSIPDDWKTLDFTLAGGGAVGLALSYWGMRRFREAPVDRNAAPLRTIAQEVLSALSPHVDGGAHMVDLHTAKGATQTAGASLIKEILETRDLVISVVGPVGSGKSTTLRRIATGISKAATKRRSPKTMAIYVDFGTLQTGGEVPSSTRIRNHVIDTIGGSDTAIRGMLEASLRGEADSAKWIFLFDSIDEIAVGWPPDHVDARMRQLFEEIRRFLRPGDIRFRAVVAIRDTFVIPRGITALTVAPLSRRQQKSLMTAAGLKSTAQIRALDHLQYASADAAGRPLAFKLWQESVLRSDLAPGVVGTVDSLFEIVAATISARLETVVRDPAKNKRTQDLAAELAAAMATSPSRSPAPPRTELVATVSRSVNVPATEVEQAIKYMEEANLVVGERPQSFSFSHRSFQDFFAAQWLSAHHDRLDLTLTLTDLRWREAVSATLLSGPDDVRTEILAAAERIVVRHTDGLVSDTIDFLSTPPGDPLPMTVSLGDSTTINPLVPYVLSIVGSVPLTWVKMVPTSVRTTADRLVVTSFIRDSRPEQRGPLALLKIMSPDAAVRAAERAVYRGGLLLGAAASAWEATGRPLNDLGLHSRVRLAWGLLQEPLLIREIALRPRYTSTGGVSDLARDLVKAARVAALILVAFGLAGAASAFSTRDDLVGYFLLVMTIAAAVFLVRTTSPNGDLRGWPDMSSGAVVLLWIGLSAVLTIVAIPTLLTNLVTNLSNFPNTAIRSYVLSWSACMCAVLVIGPQPTRQTWWFPQYFVVRPLIQLVRHSRKKNWRKPAFRALKIAAGIFLVIVVATIPLPAMKQADEDVRATLLIALFALWFFGTMVASGFGRLQDRRVFRTGTAAGELDDALLLSRLKIAGRDTERLSWIVNWTKKARRTDLARALDALGDLVRALEHVERMVPAETKTRIPRAVWDVGPRFRLPEFRQWVEDFDAAHPGKLSWLAANHSDTLSRVVDAMSTDAGPGISDS